MLFVLNQKNKHKEKLNSIPLMWCLMLINHDNHAFSFLIMMMQFGKAMKELGSVHEWDH